MKIKARTTYCLRYMSNAAELQFPVVTKLNMIRRIGRAIFAVLIGLSVAMLPAAAGFTASAASATEMSASQAVPDCDHHHNVPTGKTQKSADDGACMAACAIHCFNFTGFNVSGIAISSLVVAALKPARTSDHISSLMGSPPFRPPRS